MDVIGSSSDLGALNLQVRSAKCSYFRLDNWIQKLTYGRYPVPTWFYIGNTLSNGEAFKQLGMEFCTLLFQSLCARELDESERKQPLYIFKSISQQLTFVNINVSKYILVYAYLQNGCACLFTKPTGVFEKAIAGIREGQRALWSLMP